MIDRVKCHHFQWGDLLHILVFFIKVCDEYVRERFSHRAYENTIVFRVGESVQEAKMIQEKLDFLPIDIAN
ncbi:hypothetical protein CER18_08280 [Bartonella tribocorum]|uniref:Uncharacterized protein n=1 Tax=Bartonella tribocorum TaxID=85701 RepID=A0A2N9Y8V8_9HYPH|nr:hypothetical protein CER18_08280 [Bartonella tribocorum]